MKTVKFLKESRLLIKGISETNKNEKKKKKAGFLGMLSATSCSSLLENVLKDKATIRAGGATVRAGATF